MQIVPAFDSHNTFELMGDHDVALPVLVSDPHDATRRRELEFLVESPWSRAHQARSHLRRVIVRCHESKERGVLKRVDIVGL